MRQIPYEIQLDFQKGKLFILGREKTPHIEGLLGLPSDKLSLSFSTSESELEELASGSSFCFDSVAG